MELEKLKIGCVQFKDQYETLFAKVDKYKHFRITGCSSESCRLYVQWSYDSDVICLENSIALQKDKWCTDKVEVVATYCKIKVVCDQKQVDVEKLVVNVLGRNQPMNEVKKVDYEEAEPPKPPDRPKSPFHRFVSHKRSPQPEDEKKVKSQMVQVNDPRLPPVMFKNSLIYCTSLNSSNCLPFPPSDSNTYVLTITNNSLEWKVNNQL